jgi:predicted dithiol-disulfide oxidoreductase (DUF899 family)
MKIEAIEHKRTEVSEVSPQKVVSRAEWLVARKGLLKREQAPGSMVLRRFRKRNEITAETTSK